MADSLLTIFISKSNVFPIIFCTYVRFWVMEIKEIADFFDFLLKSVKCLKFSWFISLWHNCMVVFSLLFPLMLRFRNFWVHFACCATKNKDFRKVVVSMRYTNSFLTVCDLFSSKWKCLLQKRSLILGSVIRLRMPTCTT